MLASRIQPAVTRAVTRVVPRIVIPRTPLLRTARPFATISVPSPRPSPSPSSSPQPPRPSAFPSSDDPNLASRAQRAVADAMAYKARQVLVLRLKNTALGALMLGFVVWSYYNSIHSVRAAADSLTGVEVAEIEKELDEEQRST